MGWTLNNYDVNIAYDIDVRYNIDMMERLILILQSAVQSERE